MMPNAEYFHLSLTDNVNLSSNSIALWIRVNAKRSVACTINVLQSERYSLVCTTPNARIFYLGKGYVS